MKFLKTTRILAILLIVFFLAGDVLAKKSKNRKKHRQKIKTKRLLPDIPKEWTAFDPVELYPDFNFEGLTPACSNSAGSANDEFFFYAKRGKVNKLVVYFQGGGACWDPITCLLYKPFYPDCTEEDNPAYLGGIFDTENPENPFKDWSFVFIPYCTADIHWGANDKTYTTVVMVEDTPAIVTETIQHRGFVNFQVVLKWIEEKFKKPQKILVTGSSAGAYGALGGFPYIKEAYPKSHVSLLGDAGMGVSPPEYTQLSRPNWNTQIAPWLFDESEDFPTVSEFYDRIAEVYPRSKIAEFTNAFDGTQIWFYEFMFATLGITPPENPALDWHVKMWEGLFFNAEAPNFKYWVAPGTDHTILAGDGFYEEVSDDGLKFLDWVNGLVKNQGRPRGKGNVTWTNVSCESCMY